MYNEQEIATHYYEMTGNSPRQNNNQSPEFEGFFKKAFAEIDEMLMTEVRQ